MDQRRATQVVALILAMQSCFCQGVYDETAIDYDYYDSYVFGRSTFVRNKFDTCFALVKTYKP